ncbi:hypothetical protein [Anaerovorax odorimutans]|uniref:hypothetical protein n=1 Tax=Anaerovorax odorimutans TaxID=109327 RepID=UPI0004165C90|nr:hypothetical protein [Anaerovorax odorimutans]
MSEFKRCIFCDETAEFNSEKRIYRVKCPNCGIYEVTQIIIDQDEDLVEKYSPYKHLISGLIREKNDLNLQMEIISHKNIMSLANDALVPKTIMQKLDKILLFYYRNSEIFGQKLIINVNKDTPYAIGYTKSKKEFIDMVDTLIGLRLFNCISKGGGFREFSISLSGMMKAEELQTRNIASKQVFVAMGFNEDLLEACEKAIKPACSQLKFDALLISEIEHNGDITDKIIAEIKTSKFVITDFTYNNEGAYFEAGYAQGRGLEVIRTCKKEWFEGEDDDGIKNHLHFDINHYNFILWENYEDLKLKLINRIKATIL